MKTKIKHESCSGYGIDSFEEEVAKMNEHLRILEKRMEHTRDEELKTEYKTCLQCKKDFLDKYTP